jgi:hypothetical protein
MTAVSAMVYFMSIQVSLRARVKIIPAWLGGDGLTDSAGDRLLNSLTEVIKVLGIYHLAW